MLQIEILGELEKKCLYTHYSKHLDIISSVILFYYYLIYIIGEMNQDELGKSAKENFLVIGSSICAGIPIVEPYMDAVMAGIMPEGYEALVLPLV